MKPEITTDGRTVWVNGPMLIGRFSKLGVDVHIDGACIGEGCVPGPCTREHWELFKRKMLETHRVKISDRYMPDYLKPA